MKEELKDLTDQVKSMNEVLIKHVTETGIYRKSQGEKLVQLEHTVNGNGKIGLKTKVDRLEFAEKIRTWVLGVVFTGMITIFLNYWFNFLGK